jgi:nucleoside-diphosphate-sugar epimerase
MDWIYVEDVARLFAAAALRPDADLSRRLYNAASGAVATVPEIADHLHELVPGAEIDLSIKGDSPYVGRIDGSAARADLGVAPNDNLRENVRNYVETIRADQGLPPLAE